MFVIVVYPMMVSNQTQKTNYAYNEISNPRPIYWEKVEIGPIGDFGEYGIELVQCDCNKW